MKIFSDPCIYLFLAGIFICSESFGKECARCKIIEAERAREQAEHPEQKGYYDDYIKQKELDQKNKSTESENSSKLSLKTNYDHFFAALSDSSVENQKKEIFFEEDKIDSFKQKQNVYPESGSTSQDSVLLTLFKTKDFLETLDGEFTLFIPTDAALRRLPPQQLIELIQPQNKEKLSLLISNHLVSHKILVKDFTENNEKETKALSGRNLTLGKVNGNLTVDGIKIFKVEPAGYDGIIYTIDQVIHP